MIKKMSEIINEYINKHDDIKNILTTSSVHAKAIQSWSLSKHWMLDWQLYERVFQSRTLDF